MCAWRSGVASGWLCVAASSTDLPSRGEPGDDWELDWTDSDRTLLFGARWGAALEAVGP